LALTGSLLFDFESENPCHDLYIAPSSKLFIFPNLVKRSAFRELTIVYPKQKRASPLRVSV
jgi:hypothetical protein